MSDARRRELERATAAGDPAAEGALFAEQLRLGGLGVEKVRAAAFLGSRAATAALAARGLEVPPPGAGLDGLGARVSVVRGLVLTRVFVTFWRQRPLDGRPDEVVGAIEAMVACPCPAHAAGCAGAQEAAERVSRGPALADGQDGPLPPAWADVVGTLALAGARCAGWTAWAASRWLDLSDTSRLGGLDAAWSAAVARASHDAVDAHQRACLGAWAHAPGAAPPPFDGERLRARLVADLQAEVDSGERDPELRAARAARRARALQVEATSAAMGLARAAPDGVAARSWRAHLTPAFHRELVVAVDLPLEGGGGWVAVTWIERPMTCGLGPPLGRATVRRAAGPEAVRRFEEAMAELDPSTLDDVVPSGRDGIDANGEVALPGAPPHVFLTWCPWSSGAVRHARFFNLLLDLARACADDERARDLLADVDRYRR